MDEVLTDVSGNLVIHVSRTVMGQESYMLQKRENIITVHRHVLRWCLM